MFTGLVESVEQIKWNRPGSAGGRLCIGLGPLAEGAKIGDSICVNGACLTISELEGAGAIFDVMGQTGWLSTLSQLQAGAKVNLERAMPADGRFGGHLVQGHVDGFGKIERIERSSGQWVLWISAAPELMALMIPQGSVAVDGVSLTIVQADKKQFSVSLIPTTLESTNLSERKAGDAVNLEADLISKWIKQRLDEVLGASDSTAKLTMEKLRQQGFL